VLIQQKVVGQIYDGKKLIPDSTTYENVYVKPLYSDSLSSTYAIWVKKAVKSHKHVKHTEVVTVLQGKGVMTVGGQERKIKKGDVVIIPKGTPHAVITTSRKPLLVISVQAPRFKGKDRIWIK
jgi:mannose-6-phosphate isomerase-like protein (cupin superfamily)